MVRRFKRSYENHIAGMQELKMSKTWNWNMEIKQERKIETIENDSEKLEIAAERNANR